MASKRDFHSVNVRSPIPIFVAICLSVRPSLAHPFMRNRPSSVIHSSYFPLAIVPHRLSYCYSITLRCNHPNQVFLHLPTFVPIFLGHPLQTQDSIDVSYRICECLKMLFLYVLVTNHKALHK